MTPFSDFTLQALRHVLLVEDDQNDVELVRSALAQAKRQVTLHVVSDGAQALDFLERAGLHGDAPRPDLIVLDLGLPLRSGFEVLARVKRDARLKTIPVVVLTLSKEHSDVWRSYNLHANAYMVKPTAVEDFLTALGRLVEFYLGTVHLPPHTPLA